MYSTYDPFEPPQPKFKFINRSTSPIQCIQFETMYMLRIAMTSYYIQYGAYDIYYTPDLKLMIQYESTRDGCDVIVVESMHNFELV